MSILELEYNNSCSFDIIYSNYPSRPSKTLIDTRIYDKYKEHTFDIKTDISECLNYLKEDFTLTDSFQSKDDYIVIDYINLNNSYNKLNNYNNCIIELKDVYNYPKVQFIQLVSSLFLETKLVSSNFNNIIYIICTDRQKSLEFCKNKYIKDLNIKLDQKLINYIYNYNNYICNKINFINDKICTYSNTKLLVQDIDTLNGYVNCYINKISKDTCYNCNIDYNEFLGCNVCKTCYSLHFIETCSSKTLLLI